MRNILGLVLAGALSVTGSPGAAQSTAPCESMGYAIEYIPGVRTTWTDGRDASAALRATIPAERNGRPVIVETSENRSQGYWTDVREAFSQLIAVNPELSDYWLIYLLEGSKEDFRVAVSNAFFRGLPVPRNIVDALESATEQIAIAMSRSLARLYATPGPTYQQDLERFLDRVRTRLESNWNVVLVGHSQGNLFVNEAYRRLVLEVDNLDRIGVLHVATPGIESRGRHVTSSGDLVIRAVRLISPATLSPNVPGGDSLATTYLGHQFVGDYMAHPSLRTELLSAVNELFLEFESTEEHTCTCPPVQACERPVSGSAQFWQRQSCLVAGRTYSTAELFCHQAAAGGTLWLGGLFMIDPTSAATGVTLAPASTRNDGTRYGDWPFSQVNLLGSYANCYPDSSYPGTGSASFGVAQNYARQTVSILANMTQHTPGCGGGSITGGFDGGLQQFVFQVRAGSEAARQ